MGTSSSKLLKAAEQGDFDKVKKLVQRGEDRDAKNKDGWTALMWAADMGHLEVVKYLVDHGANKDAKNSLGRTALMWAAAWGYLRVVQYLVEQGAAKDAKDNDGSTALMGAASNGRLEVVQYLVVQGADKDAKDRMGRTALMGAASNDRLEVAKCLVEQGANKDAKNNDGWTALMMAASNGRLDVMQYLVEQGADKDIKNNAGWTALMWAITNGHLKVVQYLVEQGADKDAKDNDGETALMWVSRWRCLEMVQYLVEHGAGVNTKDNEGRTVLIRVARRRHLDKVQYLVEQGADRDAKDNDGKTALMWVADEGYLEVVKYLVEHSSDKDIKDNKGQTALMKAAVNGRLEVVKYLLDHRADTSLLDNQDNSALLLLISRPNINENKILPIVKMMLERGAPPLKSNAQAYSAKSIARDKGFHAIIDLIDEYTNKPQPDPERESPKWLITEDDIKRDGTMLKNGGFGDVYRAKWESIDVVVKVITVVEMKQFLREVKTWSELRHDNIVPFYGANNRKEPFFIVSKFASNGELVPYLKTESGKGYMWEKLKEVAIGLSYLHGKGIVHGDLKGNNIVVSEHGTAMLTDFGLSFIENGSCSIVRKKDTLGAMAWRAPEFANMTTVERPTRKSDVFSLGMCILEAVTLGDPWGDRYTNADIRECLRRGEVKVDRPILMTDDQWELVSRMICVDPDGRPSMNEVVKTLTRFARDERRLRFRG